MPAPPPAGVLIWNRLGDDRITQIESLRARYDLQEQLGIFNYTTGTGEQPELDVVWANEREAETALWLDYKSLFVFGDILVATTCASVKRSGPHRTGLPTATA